VEGTTVNTYTDRIEDAYTRLGHHLGWAFLYTPAATLNAGTRLAFVGLNPGGDTFQPPFASREDGNAHRLDRWWNGGLSPLQVQVCRMYAEIATHLSVPGPKLMDETLSTNLCPFRSPDEARLANRAASLQFSEALWRDIFAQVNPKAVICLGGTVETALGRVLTGAGAELTSRQERPVGWGEVTYSLTRYQHGDRTTLLVRLPHLSRFGIFGRPASRAATGHITSAVADAMQRRWP